MPKTDFSATEVAALTGVTYQTLDRWLKDGVVACDVPAEGTGSRRRFTYRDIVLVMLAHRMKEQGFRLNTIKGAGNIIRREWTNDDPAAAGYAVYQLGGSADAGFWHRDPQIVAVYLGDALRQPVMDTYQGINIVIDVVQLARMVQAGIGNPGAPVGRQGK